MPDADKIGVQLACPACARATEHRKLYSKNSFDIFQCIQCGLGRSECANFDVHDYYTEDYFSGGHRDGYADYCASEPVLRREFARTVQFVRQYRSGGRLLEIGCAYGFFLEEARRFYDVAGIEIADAAVVFCRRRGLTVINGMADEDNGGVIIITTGDCSSLYARVAGRNWRLMTPPQHLWYFTPESMRRLAQTVQLKLETCEHPWKLVPLALIEFQVRRLLGARRAISTGFTSRIGIPVNLFDAMRCVLRNPDAGPT